MSKKKTSKKTAAKSDQTPPQPNPLKESNDQHVAKLAGCDVEQLVGWKEYHDRFVVVYCDEKATHRVIIEKSSK